MKRLALPLALCLVPAAALAAEVTSAYVKFDPDTTCQRLEAPDEYVFGGTWICPGQGKIKMQISTGDDRDFVGFGERPEESCSLLKTFFKFNTALSPVEWRLRDGKPIAAIERWRVVADDNGNTVTWLVVNALRGNGSCHVHYVAGSYPEANAAARRAADQLAEDFNCDADVPTIDSTVGTPFIDLTPCAEVARE
jgi:hypothetical protein